MSLTNGCENDYSVSTKEIPLQLGETPVTLLVREAEAPGLTYLSLHENEQTAVSAAQETIRTHGGMLLELRHQGTRNLSFTLEDTVYTFDPNRIFSSAGRIATLANEGPSSEAARAAVAAFAEAIVHELQVDGKEMVVTVHNNTGGEYSLLSYLDDGSYAGDALFVHHAAGVDTDNFFFVTEEALYTALREADMNVVLQDNARVTDDGSLSVYAGSHGIGYVNVEAQHGHYEYQVRMLDLLNELVGDGASTVVSDGVSAVRGVNQ